MSESKAVFLSYAPQDAEAARRAVDAAPSNHGSHYSLAQALFFQKEFQSFRNSAAQAIALNPMDGSSMAFLGEMLSYAGDWQLGLELSTRAKELNPNHPGWFWICDFLHAYRQRDYRAASGYALKVNLPGHYGTHVLAAIAYGQLGEKGPAAKSLQTLLALRPNIAATIRDDAAKWWDPEYAAHFIDGLREAGLAVV